MHTKNKFCFVDLFAGGGGLSLGLEQAGFEPLFVNELNEHALETYLINREASYPLLRKKYHANDVKSMILEDGYIEDLVTGFKKDYKIDVKKGDLDLLVGGPPCQGYSGIGHRRSYSVDKKQIPSNHLYQDMAYLINRLRPKIFLFENVRGLMNSRWTKEGNKGEIWQDVQETFRKLPGYSVETSLVLAKDYGVPQNRPRVLLVGIREDIIVTKSPDLVANGYLPEATQGYPTLVELWSDLIDPRYKPGSSTTRYPHPASSAIQRKLRHSLDKGTTLPKGAEVTEHEYSKHTQKVIDKFTYMLSHNGVSDPVSWTQVFLKPPSVYRAIPDGFPGEI